MSGDYQYLRVEDQAPPATPVTSTSQVVTTGARRPQPSQLEKALSDAAYYKRELGKAIQEREEIKKSLEAADGPAADWRRQAKDALRLLSEARRTIESLRSKDETQRVRAIRFSEDVDRLKRVLADAKQQLWSVWGGMDDQDLAKKPLWNIWANL